MSQIGSAVLGLHLGKGVCHAVEPKCFELIQRWVIKHMLSSSIEVIRAAWQRRASHKDRHTFGVTDVGVSDRRLAYYPALVPVNMRCRAVDRCMQLHAAERARRRCEGCV